MTEIVDRITEAVALPLLETARAACTSRTLRDALRVTRNENGLQITVPHYWAQWFHDGRGPVTARPGHKLVYYKNPSDDPRISGGYPVRLSDVRRLTRAEFYRDLRAGKLIVAERVGPAGPNQFMGDNLTLAAGPRVAQASAQAASDLTRAALGPLLNISISTTV